MRGLLLAALLAFSAFRAEAFCFDAAAARYQINPGLLSAIAMHESKMNPLALRNNANGSQDQGLMQINSRWLKELGKHGISREMLFDGCTNVMAGAWVLAQEIQRYGMSWEAVGRYHSPDPQKRAKYAWTIYQKLYERNNVNG